MLACFRPASAEFKANPMAVSETRALCLLLRLQGRCPSVSGAVTGAPAAQEDKLGLRWRTEAEVLSGKGQFSCGARGCAETRGLATFEVPFGYTEAGQRRDALVKVSSWEQMD